MLKRCAAILIAAGLAVACGQTDAGITTSVKSKLAADDTVKAYQIDVDTAGGVVTLNGRVESAAAKDQAIRIARETNGVREVVDRLTVGETAATSGVDVKPDVDIDEAAARKAREAGEDTKEAARRGAEATRDAARKGADKVGEAADRTGAVMSDAAITTAVKTKLLADTTVGGLAIDVDTTGGVVTLNGRVSSKAEATQAMKLARETDGVKRVVDRLQVGR